jgi:hypothetical protein
MQDVKRIAKSVIRSERALRGGESFGHAGSQNQLWFPFRNEYAGEVPPFSVVEVTDCVAVPGLDLSYFKATRPSTTFRGPNWYAVTSSQAVPQGGTGQLRFEGTGRVAYDTGTPAKFENWGVKPGQFTLSKGYPSLASVHRVESSDRKLLLGTLGEIRTLLCKATAYLADGAVSTNFQIWSGTIASGANSGFTTLPSIELVQDIPTDRFFVAHWVNNGWVGRMLSGGTRLLKCKLNGDLDATDATATIDNVTSFSGEGAASPTSANNTLDLAGADNDDAVIIEDTSGASAAYYLLNVMHHDCEA